MVNVQIHLKVLTEGACLHCAQISFLCIFNIQLLVHCTHMLDALFFYLPVIFAYFECHSDCLAQPWCYWLLSPRAQIPPWVLEEPTGWRGACGHKPAPPTTHSFLSTRHEPFLPAPICQGIRQQQASLSLKQKKSDFHTRNCVWTYCVAPSLRDMLLMCLKPTHNFWLKWCSGCRIRSRRLLTPTHVSHLLYLTIPGSTICLK